MNDFCHKKLTSQFDQLCIAEGSGWFLLGNEVNSQSKLLWDEIFDEIVPGLTGLPVPALPSPNQKDRPDKARKSGNRWPYSKSSNKIPLNPASSCVDLWDLNETSAKLKEQGWILSEVLSWAKSSSFTSPWWRDLYEFHFLRWVGGDLKSAWLNELSSNSTFPFRCLRTKGKCHFGLTIAPEPQKAIALWQKTWSQNPTISYRQPTKLFPNHFQ